MKYVNRLTGILAILFVSVSCAEEFVSPAVEIDPTEKILQAEYLNSFDVLKSYMPGFKLGVGVSAADYAKKEALYGLVLTNFEEITLADGVMNYGSIVGNDGVMGFGNVPGAVQTAVDAGISIHGGPLVWHAQQNLTYLNSLLEPTRIPIEIESGTTVFTFDDVPLGTTYPMTGNGSATIETDPAGASGNVLHVGDQAARSYPKIPITLPAGRKLGDYQTVTIDFNGTGSGGLYGAGMIMGINGAMVNAWDGQGPASFGCPGGSWGRGMITLEISKLNLSDAQRALTSFDLCIGSQTGAADYYIDNIKMFYEMTMSGTIVIADFESDALGTTYPLTGNGTATVEDDPAGVSGKVLHLAGPVSYSFPVFNVKLPAGRKLGELVSIKLDFNGTGSTGLYGGGMQLGINGAMMRVSGGPADFGCPNGGWGRGLIVLPFAALNLTEAQKELTEFTLGVGSGTGSGDYWIDNISVFWESADKEIIIPQTPQEKADTLTRAMDKWIAGMMTATGANAAENRGTNVKSWDVVKNPLNDAGELNGGSDDNNFYWQDYLGRDYARVAVRLARKYGGSDLKLFVNETLLGAWQDKIDGLIAYVRYLEEDGTTKIDGISVPFALVRKYDSAAQTEQENAIDRLFTALAATGKLIRISDLSIALESSAGTTVSTANATYAQREQLGAFYEFVLRSYFAKIPAAQRGGISQGTALDGSELLGLWGSDYNRTPVYAGFAKGLGAD